MNPFERLSIVALSFVIALSSLPHAARASNTPPPRRVVIVSWDGAADWVMDRLLAEGKLPNVARLAASGARAEYSTAAFPSKTACGHASLWTGAFPDVNGITGNTVNIFPRSEHTLLEKRSGFDSAALRAEPIWVTAAKAGKRVAVLSATQAYPPDRWVEELRAARVPDDRYVLLSGFESKIADAAIFNGSSLRTPESWTGAPPHEGPMRELAFSVGDSKFFALVYDDPVDPARGFDTVLVRQGSRDSAKSEGQAILKPAEARDDVAAYSARFKVAKGDLSGFTYFRLWELSPDGGMALYQRAVNMVRGSTTRAELDAYMAAYGGFHDDLFWHYERGSLGRQVYAGGDGTAERRLLEAVRLDVEFRKRGVRYAIQHWSPELLLHYTPMTDSAGHMWVGALDPTSPRYDEKLAAKLWPYYEAVYRLEDAWLGEIIDAAGQNAAIFLVSDHGMTAQHRRFYPNAVLERAGLLARTYDEKDRRGDEIDLSRTRACVPPYSDFFVTVNSTDRKGGVVPPGEREAVLQAATDALLAAVDPDTGQRIVTSVFRAEGVAGLGTGGEVGGDLYLELAPGYYPEGRLSSVLVEPTQSPIGGGAHGYLPLRRSMQAICIVGGAGVMPGAKLGGVRQIDVAPTAARLLGIAPPRDAQGHVLGEILQ